MASKHDKPTINKEPLERLAVSIIMFYILSAIKTEELLRKNTHFYYLSMVKIIPTDVSGDFTWQSLKTFECLPADGSLFKEILCLGFIYLLQIGFFYRKSALTWTLLIS